ncbi:MAG TPA: hypothetical protein P5228_10715 [Bacteroidales bacterium]|nr:hypothetical protein [Bacteroidales bacterium]HRZ49093.1 hypothetical protein [Bacteroidales bacterium]
MKLEQYIDADTIEWLLEQENPSIRYFTLTKLLKKSESDHDVLDARRDIMHIGIVPALLDKQNEAGYWGDLQKFYPDKYKGTVWQLIILAEMGADANDIRIKKACEFILDNSQDNESYGFSMNRSSKMGGGRHSEVIPCLTGNMLWSLIKLGYLSDERVQKGIGWICRYQRSDDGISETPKEWPYDKYEMCWGRHTCHMGVVKSLKALSAIPKEKRSKSVTDKIETLSEFILIHHIYRKSHDLKSISKPGWLRLGFPHMYQSDILEILEILVELGINDSRMNDAIDKLISKQNKEKRWNLENTFNGRMIKNIETKGESSKWITLKALNVLINQ